MTTGLSGPALLEPLAGRGRRISQVTLYALLAVVASAAVSLAQAHQRTAAVLLALAAALAFTWCLAARGREQFAVATLLGSLLLGIGTLAWLHRGLNDLSLLALPAILMYAGMLGRTRLFFGLGVSMLAFTGLIMLADTQGWRAGPSSPSGALVHVWGILIATGACVWMLTGDLRRALRLLQQENRRVHESHQALHRQARRDALTGLPNRLSAREHFEALVRRDGRERRACAALLLDLDHFRSINESLGHAAGDRLLCQAAQRLQGRVVPGDVLCCLGGDEFLLLHTPAAETDDVSLVAGALIEAMAPPFRLDGMEVPIGCSVGVALSPADGPGFEELLKNADIAMYRAKAVGGRMFRFFDPGMQAGVADHAHLLSGLRQALSMQQFELHYQPQLSLADGRLLGAEALLRWRHPELGWVPPNRFIPLAERSGLIVEIGAWVMQEACRQAAAWDAAGLPALVMSVNLSSVQLRRGDIEATVMRALHASGLPADRLEIELTESMIVDDARHVTETLRHLVAAGLRLAIDDFGTGYSNLGYLKRFDVGRLKIDQSFVRRLTQDEHDRAIVGAIVQMARSLGLSTIAEGVEDVATLACLRELGCHEGQGYLWSRPLPAAAFETYARQQAAPELRPA